MKNVSRRQFITRGLGYAATGAGVTVWGLGKRPAWAAGQPTVLKLGHADTVLHPSQTVATRFAELVKERTGGSIEVRIFPVGQLGSMANVMSGLTTGIVDLAMSTTGFLESFFPRIEALDLPFLFKDNSSAERLLDGPIGQGLLTDMQTKGIYGLTWGHFGWRLTETNAHALKAPADFKGLKIRVQPGTVFAATFRAVGAIPVVIDLSELYLAISQGTVNGYELPFLAVISSKLVEVTKYIGLTNHVYNAGALMASKIRLDALTPKEQEVIRGTAKEIQPFWRKLIAEKSLENRKTCEERGLIINDTDYPAFQKAMQPVYAEFRPKIGPEFVDQVMKAAGA
jgi:tripartite ATP-independent transporter DctP family solute receptor